MHRRYMAFLMSLIFTMSLIFSGSTSISRAQDGPDLSEEEQALLDKFFAGIELQDTYESYAFFRYNSLSIGLEITIPGVDETVSLAQSKILGQDGYILRVEDAENRYVEYTLNYSNLAPGDISAYEMVAEAIFLDGQLYLNPTFNRAEGNFEPIVEGWQVFTSEEELTSNYEELDLEDYFTDDPDVFEDRELVESSVSSVTSAPFTRDNGLELELITITIAQENFAKLMQGQLDDDPDNPFNAIFLDETATSNIIIQGGLDEDGNIVYMEMQMSFSITDLDATAILGDEAPSGTSLSMTLNGTLAGEITDINGEFEPIVAPELETEE